MRQISLIEWIPKYLQEYRELKKIMDVENPEIKQLYDEIAILMDNLFIHTCNEDGIARFEKLLDINPDVDDTLDIRITRVLSRWTDSIPYTYKGLLRKLDILCGEGNYEIELDNNAYTLKLDVLSMTIKQLQELKYMLSYMIPANIAMDLEARREVNISIYTGIGINRIKNSKVNISPHVEDLIESSFFVGVGVKRCKKIKVQINQINYKAVLGRFVCGAMKVGEINDNT